MYWSGLLDEFDPWRELNRLQREVNRLVDDFGVTRRRVFPEVNIWTNDDSALVTAELPGIDPKDINLSVKDQNLVIEGERKAKELKEGEKYHRQERGYGSFQRAIQLPFAVNSDKIAAKFKNGVLTVTLPRAEEDKPKKIEIK